MTRAGSLFRRIPYFMRALRNPVIAKPAVIYALLPRFLWSYFSVSRRIFGITERLENDVKIISIAGCGSIAIPANANVYQILRTCLVRVLVLDEYEACKFLTQGMVVIDAGAHVGSFSLLASQLVGPAGRVLAVEPETHNYQCLCKTIEINGLSNVIPVQKAVGHTEGEGQLFLAERTGAHSLLFVRTGDSVTVPLTTIDKLCEEQGLERLDFLKIDVEGFEPQVLEGAQKSIVNFRPVLSIAAYHFEEHKILLPALIKQIVPDYQVKVVPAAPQLELKCFAVPVEKLSSQDFIKKTIMKQ